MALRFAGHYGTSGGASGVIANSPAARQMYAGAFRPNFGAESYERPGVECSVDEITAAGGDTWANFCDCSFAKPLSQQVWHYNNAPLFPPPGLGIADPLGAGALQWLGILKDQMGVLWNPKLLEFKPIDGAISRGPEWSDCMSKFCAAATGCWNPSKKASGLSDAESWDHFNIHPGMWGAPWTEFGAGARGIDKRNAGFWYTIATATTINFKDFSPLRMFVLSFTNPVRFGVLAGVSAIFGTSIVYLNPALLFEAAMAQAIVMAATGSAGQEELMQEAIIPLAQFGFGVIGAFLALMTGNIPGAVAKVVKMQAQTLLSSGRAPVDVGPMMAVIYALANFGEDLADLFNPARWGEAGTWMKLGKTIQTVAECGIFGARDPATQKLPLAAQAIYTFGQSLKLGAKTVNTIVMGDDDMNKKIATALDDLCVDFFGFTYTSFKNSIGTPDFDAILRARGNPDNYALFGLLAPAMESILKVLVIFIDAVKWLTSIFGGWDLASSVSMAMHQVIEFLDTLRAVSDATGKKPSPVKVIPADAAINPPVVAPVAPPIAAAPRLATVTQRAMSTTKQAVTGTISPADARALTIVPPAKSSGGGLVLAGVAAWLLL